MLNVIIQVTVNVSGELSNFSNPTYHTYEQAVEVKSVPVEQDTTQVRKPEHLAFFVPVLSCMCDYAAIHLCIFRSPNGVSLKEN